MKSIFWPAFDIFHHSDVSPGNFSGLSQAVNSTVGDKLEFNEFFLLHRASSRGMFVDIGSLLYELLNKHQARKVARTKAINDSEKLQQVSRC